MSAETKPKPPKTSKAIPKSKPKKATMQDFPALPPTISKLQRLQLELVPVMQKLKWLATKKFLVCGYLFFALFALASTTVLWSILSARVQGSNADQIVDPYLFSDGATFHGAGFPGAHTFLLKWPLFWLVKLLGVSSGSLIGVTVLVTLLTVGALAWLLYRLERRPVVFATLCLALASCLLLVPTQPALGALLPVNMAMLATRNVEYILYLLSIGLLVKARRTRNWHFWVGAAGLGLLVASDKLFLAMSIGGAMMALLVYALRRNWRLVETAARWLLAGLLAAVLATVALALLQQLGVTYIVGQADTAPYQAAHGAKNILLGVLYAGLGFLANFGADPATGTVIAGDLPHQAIKQLLSLSGLARILNLVLVAGGLFVICRQLRNSLFARFNPRQTFGRSEVFSLALIWTSIAAVAVFIGSDHYYPVDARYLTIGLFAVFVAVAVYTRQRPVWNQKYLMIAGAVLTLGMLLAIPNVVSNYHASQQAYASANQRDELITQAISHHHVDVLVGDYWRVLPTKLSTNGSLNVLPLGGCAQARNTLTSSAWQPDLSKHSFAYLLSYDKGLTDFPNCTLSQVVAAYGRPNASILIAGNFAHPHEVLLFYDHGSHQSVPPSTKLAPQPLASVVPISIDQLPNTSCNGPTIMNVVAHQDDDLLFMNPDLQHDIREGHCVRTVYVTAGDAGSSEFYWLSRQQGSEDAYATMLNTKDLWAQRIVKLSDSSYITVVNPMGNSKVSLIFLNLPDGGLRGDGFPTSHNQSLAKLEAGHISKVTTVDHESTYTMPQLTDTLALLMHTYQPAEIRTQATQNMSDLFPDHSDHLSVGRLTTQAYTKYETDQYENEITIPISYYIGYPIHAMNPNVSGIDLNQKEAAFLAYAKHDGSVCHTASQCTDTPTYGAYLAREYTVPR